MDEFRTMVFKSFCEVVERYFKEHKNERFKELKKINEHDRDTLIDLDIGLAIIWVMRNYDRKQKCDIRVRIAYLIKEKAFMVERFKN